MLRIRAIVSLAAILSTSLAVAFAWGSPTWRPMAESQLSGAVGSDKGTSYVINGDCDSKNASEVLMGQDRTINCADCNTQAATDQKICICCEGGGAINMGLVNANPNTNVTGINGAAPFDFDCGMRSAASCVFSDGNTAFCNPRPTGKNCSSVLEYPVQIVSPPPGH